MGAYLLLSLLGTSLFCAFIGTRLVTWTIALTAIFVLFGLVGQVSLFAMILTGLVLGVILIPLNMPAIRQQFLSAPFLKVYKTMLPNLSPTERDAMEAGTVGWEGDLFSGKPDWKVLLKKPWLKLTAEEQAFVDGPVEELCGMLRQWEISHEQADLSPEVWTFIKKTGSSG